MDGKGKPGGKRFRDSLGLAILILPGVVLALLMGAVAAGVLGLDEGAALTLVILQGLAVALWVAGRGEERYVAAQQPGDAEHLARGLALGCRNGCVQSVIIAAALALAALAAAYL